ncbi:MAG: anti-sigma factor [Chloroflexi bacterium]|nr:anti-sigma factor [Chloroflexota bacterium]
MKYCVLVISILLLLLVSCGPGPEEMPPATPTAAPTPAAPPTSVPAVESESTEPPAAASTATLPPAPEAADTPTAEPAPTIQADGTASFRDNLATADQFILELTGGPAPPDGQAYQGWLLSDDGTPISVGVLNLESDGSITLAWNSPNSENLLSRYARFHVTLEPVAGSATPTGEVVFAGGLDGDALASARRLFVRNEDEPATPLNTAFALGLVAQTDIALQHVQNAVNAAAIGALPEMRAHLEHSINILDGAAGARFSDHDGSGTAQNPGDGFGTVGYARQIAELLDGQETAVKAAINVQTQSAIIQDKCTETLQAKDMATAIPQIEELKGLAKQLKADAVAKLYQAAQHAVSFQVTLVE